MHGCVAVVHLLQTMTSALFFMRMLFLLLLLMVLGGGYGVGAGSFSSEFNISPKNYQNCTSGL